MTMATVSGIINDHHHYGLLYTDSKIMMELRSDITIISDGHLLSDWQRSDSNDISLPANVLP